MSGCRGLGASLLCLLVCSSASPARAQGVPSALLEEMQKLRGQPIKTDEDMRRAGRLLTQFSWELLKQASTSLADRQALDSIGFDFERTDRATPARVSGQSIVVSIGPMFELMSSALVLGHDIFVNGGAEYPMASPLAYRPLARSALLPLADPLAAWVQAGALHVICAPEILKCSAPQGTAALVGTLAFVLAHEASHILLKHPDGPQATARERAADEAAAVRLTGVLALLAKEDTLTDDVRTAVLAAPPLMMMFWKSRRITRDWVREDDALVSEYEQRRQHLLGLLNADDRAAVDELLDPLEMRGGLGTMIVRSSDRPDVVYVDGASFSQASLEGRPVAMRPGRHIVFARAGNKLAYANVYVESGEQENVRLVFRDPECGRDEQTLDALAKKRQWFEVLIASGGLSCGFDRPNGIRVYEALHRMRVGFLIPAAPANLASDREIKSVDLWRKNAGPLADWR